mmetsp:Transcript_26952/g.67637  ORF Transcript_26952/g.67637 Transcript_26952/m.67637 type:complete len:134 (+) Transcript_26952:90-491(+)
MNQHRRFLLRQSSGRPLPGDVDMEEFDLAHNHPDWMQDGTDEVDALWGYEEDELDLDGEGLQFNRDADLTFLEHDYDGSIGPAVIPNLDEQYSKFTRGGLDSAATTRPSQPTSIRPTTNNASRSKCFYLWSRR